MHHTKASADVDLWQFWQICEWKKAMSSKSGQSNNMDKWMEDAKVRIKDFKKSHALQRVQLELAFETAPRDSRYSNGLIDMMRKEEVIIAKDPNSSVTKSVSQKVDENLRAETRGFFNKSVQKNAKRWAILKEKFDHETQQFARGLTTELKAFSNVKGSAPPLRVNHTPTAEELDEEADRLECDYNKNWYKYENFNLQEAFKSQNNRIENDWGAHERTLEEEFQARREKIAGPQYGRGASSQSPAHAATHDPRWQHPEKQKTLIHTAPVLSPTKMQMGGSDTSGWAKGKDQGAINQELERIQAEYDAAVAGMQKQKGDAKRWLLRQQVRLQAQAMEVQHERAIIGDLQGDDLAVLQALTRAIRAAENQ